MACAFGRVGFRSSVWMITVTAAAEVHVSTPSAAVNWRISRPVAAEPGTDGVRGDDESRPPPPRNSRRPLAVVL